MLGQTDFNLVWILISFVSRFIIIIIVIYTRHKEIREQTELNPFQQQNIHVQLFVLWLQRALHPPEVKHERLFVVSVLGFFVNLIGIFVFHHGGASGNFNYLYTYSTRSILQSNLGYLVSWGLGWMVRIIESPNNQNMNINQPRTKLEKSKWNFTWQRSKSEPIKAQWNAQYYHSYGVCEHKTRSDLCFEAKQIQYTLEFHRIIWRKKCLLCT